MKEYLCLVKEKYGIYYTLYWKSESGGIFWDRVYRNSECNEFGIKSLHQNETVLYEWANKLSLCKYDIVKGHDKIVSCLTMEELII